MSYAKTGIVFLLSSTFAACGGQVVQFGRDSGRDVPTEVRADVGADISGDASGDAPRDVAPDAPGGTDALSDANVDRAADAGADIRADAASDGGADVRADASAEAGAEAGVDLRAEGGADSGLDAGVDVQVDLGLDVLPDVSGLAPMVTLTTPADMAPGVSINHRPSATFNEPMDPDTINILTFTVMQGLIPVLGTVMLDSATNVATFTPLDPLMVNTLYTATISTGARDAGGRPLSMSFTWTFRTAACSQALVNLRSVASFAVLAGSTVTSTGLTTVVGDMGVSPGTAVTGFPPGVLVGALHSGDPTSALALASLTTAYDDAKGRVLCPVSIAGNLGGMTLYPGLYKSTSSLEISSGDLTLDAQGDGDAIFIFQMASTLTTTAGRQVFLTNGTKSANVFWQVGTSATIGTTSSFFGTIMADQAITLNHLATLTGRALARIAAVDLDANMIGKPAP